MQYNVEAVYQLGSFGSQAIRAYTLSGEFTYTLSRAGWKPCRPAPAGGLFPAAGLEVTLDADFFWRHRPADGLYGVPYVLLREDGGSQSRRIGDQFSLTAAWQANSYLGFELFFTYFVAGNFLKDTGAGRNLTFIAPRVTFRF